MDIVCLYHADCFDGLGAAWALKQKYPDADFRPMDYRDPVPMDLAGKHVFVVDFCFNDYQDMEYLAITCASLTLLDHHDGAEQTAIKLQDFAKCTGHSVLVVFDKERSGALITWQHFFPDEPVPAIIQHISDRDLWDFKLEGTREVMAGLGMYALNMQTWETLFASFETEDKMIARLYELGHPLVLKSMTDTRRVIEQTLRYVEIEGIKVPLINVPRSMASEALTILAANEPFAVGYYDDATHRVFSLRSRKGSDVFVNAIARRFGGNGHPHAAGFVVERDHPLAQY